MSITHGDYQPFAPETKLVNPDNDIVNQIVRLFLERGDSQYGGEAVTQAEHGLQAGLLAEQAGESSSLIAAALLHDVGHLLHDLPADAPSDGIDDRHEDLGNDWLVQHFGPAVCEPVRMHVEAKRYLCTVEAAYGSTLSPASITSLKLQGGRMSDQEVREFESSPHYADAVKVRRWDDLAKVSGLETPDIEHFRPHLQRALADVA